MMDMEKEEIQAKEIISKQRSNNVSELKCFTSELQALLLYHRFVGL